MRASSLCSSIVLLMAVRVRSSFEKSLSALAVGTGIVASSAGEYLRYKYLDTYLRYIKSIFYLVSRYILYRYLVGLSVFKIQKKAVSVSFQGIQILNRPTMSSNCDLVLFHLIHWS